MLEVLKAHAQMVRIGAVNNICNATKKLYK